MTNHQQTQAQRLYFQTDLSKTEIAETLGISRRSLHYWIHDNNWDHIRKNSENMPSMLAERCYFILGDLTKSLLGEDRIGKPATMQEVNSIYKLTLTINKLKKRNTLNESLEMFGWFMENLSSKNPELAQQVAPYIESYIGKHPSMDASRKPAAPALTKAELEERERLLDLEDEKRWAEEAAAKQAAAAQTPVVSPALTPSAPALFPAPTLTPSAPALHSPQVKEKVDLRKLLRGTATTGPGKNFYRSGKKHAA